MKHVECYSHMMMTLSKKRNVQRDGYSFVVPQSFLSNTTTPSERAELVASTKRFIFNEIYYVIKLVRESKSSAIAELILQMFLDGLRKGFVRGIPFPLTTLADRLRSSFNRVTTNGSFGLWRYSDVFHENVTVSPPPTVNQRFSEKDILMSIPLSTSSLEARNGDTKMKRGRMKDRVIGLCKNQQSYMAADSFQEFEISGISYTALPFGGGSALSRCTSSTFKNEITDGMAFTGRLASDIMADQRELHYFETSSNRLYLLNNRTDVKNFKEKACEELGRQPTLLELQAKFKECILRYDYLKRQNMSEVLQMITSSTRDSISSGSYAVRNEKYWFQQKFSILKKVNQELRQVVVVSPLSRSCNFEEISRHEKFRLSMEKDKNYMFEFQCNCESALTKGFCGHIFFRKHYRNDSQQPIPACCWDNSMNAEGLRRGRPRQSAPALFREEVLM